MLIACDSCISPELTNPTTITVVADEDWITAVTPAPSSIPLTGLAVNRSRMCLSLPPACFSSPSPISVMPYKNTAKPPSIVKTLKKDIRYPPSKSPSTCMLTAHGKIERGLYVKSV